MCDYVTERQMLFKVVQIMVMVMEISDLLYGGINSFAFFNIFIHSIIFFLNFHLNVGYDTPWSPLTIHIISKIVVQFV